ncbi:MAG: hypothetical protein RIF41_25735 [Polyangiaceae bacterium]
MARGVPLSACLALGLLACGEPKPKPVSSDGWGPTGHGLDAAPTAASRPAVPRATAIPAAKRVAWPRAAELDAFTAVAGRGPSEHLSGRYERRVRVNDRAAGYVELVPHRALPVGAVVAQSHHASGSEAIASWYVMEKTPDGWRFVVLDPERRVAAHEDLEPCARCHAEAPHDGLFGPPPTAQEAVP